jgi:hypothetical protein
MNQSKKPPVLSILLYVIAAILVIYVIWAFICCYAYISKLIAGGQLTANGNEFTIVSYYMTNCIQYLFYSMAFSFFGKLYSSVTHKGENSTKEPPDGEKEELSTIFETDGNKDTDDFSNWNSTQ